MGALHERHTSPSRTRRGPRQARIAAALSSGSAPRSRRHSERVVIWQSRRASETHVLASHSEVGDIGHVVSTTASALLLDEWFASGDPRFLAEVLACSDPKRLFALAPKWGSDARTWARTQLIAYIADGCDRPGHRALVKYLFKGAERRGDDELMACFAAAFDALLPFYIKESYNWRLRDTVAELRLLRRGRRAGIFYRSPKSERSRDYRNPMTGEMIKGKKSTQVRFSVVTRGYLQRRAWRYFRNLGRKDEARFAKALKHLLLAYPAQFPSKPEHITPAWSLMHLFFYRSPQLRFSAERTTLAGGVGLSDLKPTPYRPKAWEKQAIDLLRALPKLNNPFVRATLANHLRTQPSLQGMSPALVLPLFFANDDALAELGNELLQSATGFESLPLSAWRSLLQIRHATSLAFICEKMRQVVLPDRASRAECIELAGADIAAIATLGFEWLQTKPSQSRADYEDFLALLRAPVAAVYEGASQWALERLQDPLDLRAWFDSRHATVRAAGIARFQAESEWLTRSELWSALAESPYADVQRFVIERLDILKKTLTPGSKRWLWSSAILAVASQSRIKPVALQQMAAELIRDPSSADSLLPLMRVGLRGLRVTERRSSLSALMTALGKRPELADSVKKHIPELELRT